MPDELTFMMGLFKARFPLDRRYASNHMWAATAGGGLVRFGFSAYAVRLLQDVYFLDWSVDAPCDLAVKQQIGEIESSKAESLLYAPTTGRLVEINRPLLSDPSLINVDPYDRGWLFAMETPGDDLLSPEDYLVHLEAAWKLAQRTIKGQMNE
jgi:glycine cleavage system H protein